MTAKRSWFLVSGFSFSAGSGDAAAGDKKRGTRNEKRLFALLAALILFTGCGPKKPQTHVPPPPDATRTARNAPVPPTEAPAAPAIAVPRNARVLYSEVGLASWYGAPYHNRRGANGEIYDMNAATAAHRTLPLNAIVRVTNLANGRSTLLRITDRGPFIAGRVIDLSLAAAREIDVWRAGVARVQVDVLETPAPIERGGRWCVQIGAFTDADAARDLRDKLARRYHTARVQQFAGPTGEWLRIRVAEDDRHRAESLARETQTPAGGVFLVRLD